MRFKEHKGTIGALAEQQAALDAGISVTRDKISQEIAKIVPAANEMLDKFNEQLQSRGDEILGAVNNIKDQTFDIGKEVGKYEGIVEANQWLMNLNSLVKGEENLNPTQVRAILLLVMHGSQSWTKRNQEKVGVNSTIPQALALLVEGLEQWQV